MNILEEIFSKWIIKSVQDIHYALTDERFKSKSRKTKSFPDLKCWLKCYRKSKKHFILAFLKLSQSNERNSVFLDLLYFHLLPRNEQYKIMHDDNLNVDMSEKKEIYQEFNIENFKKEFTNTSDVILNEDYKNLSHDQIIDIISDHEVQFFFQVTFPCLVLHGEMPSQLLRKARLGDEQSIKKLARIDHSVIHDRIISHYIHVLSFKNPTRHKLLVRSLVKNHPKPKLKDLKIDAAALIYMFNVFFSKALKTKKMPSSHIRQLFVNEAKLHGRDDDIDLPPGDEAFYKGIKRQTMWNDLVKLRDKK